jgi:hypothetical protein
MMPVVKKTQVAPKASNKKPSDITVSEGFFKL